MRMIVDLKETLDFKLLTVVSKCLGLSTDHITDPVAANDKREERAYAVI
jgi:hypothetical protein